MGTLSTSNLLIVLGLLLSLCFNCHRGDRSSVSSSVLWSSYSTDDLKTSRNGDDSPKWPSLSSLLTSSKVSRSSSRSSVKEPRKSAPTSSLSSRQSSSSRQAPSSRQTSRQASSASMRPNLPRYPVRRRSGSRRSGPGSRRRRPTRRRPTSRRPVPAEVNFREQEKLILDRILDARVYDVRLRPNGLNKTDGPTVVKVNLFVRSFDKIDDVKMEYSLQITFRQQWTDDRLVYDDMHGRLKYLTLVDWRKVWMPDTFFRNERRSQFHNIIQPNLYVRVHPNGEVLYSIRVSLTLTCPMDLKLFPLDSQTCHLRVASYGFTTLDVSYEWKMPEPVEFVTNLFSPGGFELYSHLSGTCDVVTNTGSYSCLTVDMVFQRQISYYIITIYVPTFMTVMVSWMSFWLDYKSAPARVSLTITTLLAMSTTTASINTSLPPVAYTKAIDVWSNLCVTFVFLALLEYALVNYAARSDARANALRVSEMRRLQELQRSDPRVPPQRPQTQRGVQGHPEVQRRRRDEVLGRLRHLREERHHEEDEYNGMVGSKRNLLLATLPKKKVSSRFRETAGAVQVITSVINRVSNVVGNSGHVVHSEAKRIDVVSRILFPLTFAAFNVVYWTYYLTMSYLSIKRSRPQL